MQYGKLHYRFLERDKIQAVKLKKWIFDGKMNVYFAGKEDTLW